MKLYSYIVVHDGGFAPNPFWGYCTLANCKPKIRRTVKVGDWIVGLSRKAKGNRVIYAMQVEEILNYGQYYHDKHVRPCHVIWGWLQIAEVLPIESAKPPSGYEWAEYHPHFREDRNSSWTVMSIRRPLVGFAISFASNNLAKHIV